MFLSEYRSKESEHGREIDLGTSFFLVQILKKLLYTWRMTRIQLILPAKSTNDGSWGTQFPRWKKLDECFTLYHISFTIKQFQYSFFTFPSTECTNLLMKKHE